jgi:hypothetical protein
VHGLTKALVLLAALASIFLAALTMSFQVNAETLRTELVSARALADTNETKLSLAESEHTQIEERLRRDYDRVQNELTQLKNSLRTVQATAEQLRADKLGAEQEAEQAKNRIGQIAGTVETQSQMMSSMEQENLRLRQGELTWKQNEIALADRIADLESALEVREQANRALQEELARLRRQIEGGGSEGAGPGIVIPAMGRVVSVEQDRATGAMLARINLGTNDGVFDDQTIYVTRPGQGDRSSFVGHLRIIRTDLQWSIGRFDDLGTGAQIRADDVVLTQFRR